MNKLVRIGSLVVVLLLVFAAPVMALDGEAETRLAAIEFSSAFGAGLIVIGASYGISRIATAALEAMARQPSIAGNAQLAMIIAAALIEGFTFAALFVGL